MSSSVELTTAKTKLAEALGETMEMYLNLLRSWFHTKITRDDFDHEARKLLPDNLVHLHNQFLLAILAKCHALGSSMMSNEHRSQEHKSPTKVRRKSGSGIARKRPLLASPSSAHPTRPRYQQQFEPANQLQAVLPVNLPSPEQDEKGLSFSSSQLFLPDIGMVHGRMIVGAWDYGMDTVDDDAVRILMHATQVLLKNVLSCVFSRRSSYRLKDGSWKHAFGSQSPQRRKSWMFDLKEEINNDSSGISQGVKANNEKTSATSICMDSCDRLTLPDTRPHVLSPISLYDLYGALQVHRSAIPSHAVYSTNMERIINKLWHPSREELDQERIHAEEMTIKSQIKHQQAVLWT